MGSAPPWAGAAAPAPAVRRRENLRSASFRDYAMAEPAGARFLFTGQPCQRPGVTPAPNVKAALRWRWHEGRITCAVFSLAAGAAAPAPAVRRRENLRGASFRDHAMARLSPTPKVRTKLRGE